MYLYIVERKRAIIINYHRCRVTLRTVTVKRREKEEKKNRVRCKPFEYTRNTGGGEGKTNENRRRDRVVRNVVFLFFFFIWGRPRDRIRTSQEGGRRGARVFGQNTRRCRARARFLTGRLPPG